MVDAFSPSQAPAAGRVWAVGPLMRAVADTLAARFNPVAVRGEISGFSRAASGHCYFALKDETGQVRCAMFRRAADQLSFSPRDGQLVQARGKLDDRSPAGLLHTRQIFEDLRKDLATEYRVRDSLRSAMALCERHGDYNSRDLLLAQLRDTEEDHAYWLEKQLGLIEKIGLPNYLQSKMGEPA